MRSVTQLITFDKEFETLLNGYNVKELGRYT